MNDLNQEIERILSHLDKERWIAFSKDNSSTRFKAKDKLRAYGLIERHGNLSWQLTKEGYKAVELGGFTAWLKAQNQNGLLEKVGGLLSKFWWYFIIPIIVGVVIWTLTQRKVPNFEIKEPDYDDQLLSSRGIATDRATGTDTIKPITDTSKIYLHSYSPVELFNGDLIITLNNSIEAVNGEIELKLVQKSALKTEIVGKKKVGDIIIFKNYIISLLSLERNYSTYYLIIKIESKK